MMHLEDILNEMKKKKSNYLESSEIKNHWSKLSEEERKHFSGLFGVLIKEMERGHKVTNLGEVTNAIEKNKPSMTIPISLSLGEVDVNTVNIEGLTKILNQFLVHIQQLQEKLKAIKNPEIKIPPVNLESVASAIDRLPILETKDILKGLSEIKKSIVALKFPEIKEKEIDLSLVVKAINNLETKIENLKTKPIDNSPLIEATEGVEAAIKGLRFPVPTPVTQIDVNPLRGVFKSTAVSVGTTAVALPASNLANRRSVIVYNNDASVNLFLGGSDVTTNNGIVVAAASYSPPVDAGSSMTLFGIVASGTVNARVFEMSNDAIGSA